MVASLYWTVLMCLAAPPASPVSPSAVSEAERAAVVGLIAEQQKAAFERLDFDTYLAAATEETVWVMGRGPEPGPHDAMVPFARVQARAAVKRHQKLTKMQVQHTVQSVERADDGAIRVRLLATIGSEGFWQQVGEIYVVRKTDKGWKILRNRTWPELMLTGGHTVIYSAATFARLDREAAAASGVSRVYALLDAWQMAEAHRAAGALTGSEPGASDPDAWVARATTAMTLARMDDLRAAVVKLKALSPTYELPDFMKLP